jgi:hypothetical protein
MDAKYNIVISIKTPEGVMEIGNFFIGDDEDAALTTFYSLNGYNDADDKSVLHINLIKNLSDTVAQYMASISCTLDQYVENCRIITRDAFKHFTMER